MVCTKRRNLMYQTHQHLVADNGVGRLPADPSNEDFERVLYAGVVREYSSMVRDVRPGMLPTLSVEKTDDGFNFLSDGHLTSISLPCDEDDVYEALATLCDKVTA